MSRKTVRGAGPGLRSRLQIYPNSPRPWKDSDEEAGYVLFHGDCRQVLDRFPAETFDCIMADPPYFLSNGGRTFSKGRAGICNKGAWDKSSGAMNDWAFHLSWINACRRVLKPSGTLWIFGTYHSIYQCGLTLQQLGFRILNEVIWYKPNAAPNLSCRVLTASHETIIWARREPKAKHTFNYAFLREEEWPKDFLKRPGKQMRSVWAIYPPRAHERRFGKHPTQKPVELLRRMVLASTNPGDVVLDPFAGSGTTGVAALEAGRLFVGIETSKRYLEISGRRLRSWNDDE